MARSKLVGLVFEAWNDLDRVVAGVSPDLMVQRIDGGSSFAWTYAHVTNMVDAWVNVRFQSRPPHPVVGRESFRIGGSGAAEDWREVKAAVSQVRIAARRYLEGKSRSDLDVLIPYDGSISTLRESGLNLRYALLRIVVHHYFHIGEIATKRERLGHQVGDFPSALAECL